MSLTPTEKAIALIEQLPADQRAAALDFLQQLAQKPFAGFDEPSLLEIIQRPAPIDPARLEDLRDREQIGRLKPEEEQELLQAPAQLQRDNIERLQDLPSLAQELGMAIPQVF
jgi:hypothetical protein